MFAPFTMLDQGPYGLDFTWPDDPDHALPMGKDGFIRCEYTTWGPWSLVRTMRALAVETHERPGCTYLSPRIKAVTIWGFRSLQAPREDGYTYRGRVKVGGRRLKAFASDKQVTYHGKLATLAVLYAYAPKAVKE